MLTHIRILLVTRLRAALLKRSGRGEHNSYLFPTLPLRLLRPFNVIELNLTFLHS